MNTCKTIIKNSLLCLITLTMACSQAFSQGTDSRSWNKKSGGLFLGLNVVPKAGGIRNTVFHDSLASKNESSVDFSVEGGYFFSKNIGISVGAGLSSFSSKFSVRTPYAKNFKSNDGEEDFRMIVDGNSIGEEQKIKLLSIPVCMIFKYPAGKEMIITASAGISANIPLAGSYEGSGTFSYAGFYDAYPVTLRDIPGIYPSDYSTSASGDLKIKPMIMAVSASAGAGYLINKSMQLSLSLFFNKSLGSISAYSPDGNFKLTTKVDELNSIMSGSENSGFQSLGLSLGLKYYLK